jgi:hypothetical protein
MISRIHPSLLKRAGLTTISMAVATVVIGVALALFVVQLSGTVSSNEFIPPTTSTTTTTTTLPPGSGLEAAFVLGPSDCSPFIPTGVPSFDASTFNLNSVSTSQVPSGHSVLCVRNAGTDDINTLTITATAAVSGEDGCSAAESTVDPEGATCGSDGELDDIIRIILSAGPGEDGSCTVATETIVPLDSPTTLLLPGNGDPDGHLGQNRACTWFVSLAFVDGVTNDQKLAASTDTVEFGIDITST